MEVYVTELMKYLKKRFKITIIAADSKSRSNSEVDVISVPIFGGFVLQPVSLTFFSFFAAFRFRKKISLINTQTPLSGMIAYIFKKLFGIPYIVSVHIFAASREHTGNRIFAGIYYLVEKIVYSAADKIVCAGYRLRNHIVDRYQLDDDLAVVIHPGAGAEAIDGEILLSDEQARFTSPESEFTVLFLGRLIKENGIMDLLEAMKLIADKPVKLLIAGNGNLEMVIRNYVQKEHLQDKVELLGIVRGENKKALLQRADAVIRTSYHEVFPVVYLEALSSGVPVIATPVGDAELIAERTGGIEIVPVNKPQKVAEAIIRRMEHPGLSLDTISKCREYLNSISWEEQTAKTICLFDSIISCAHENK